MRDGIQKEELNQAPEIPLQNRELQRLRSADFILCCVQPLQEVQGEEQARMQYMRQGVQEHQCLESAQGQEEPLLMCQQMFP